MFKYSISLKWSNEDNGFIAFVPELPGLSAFGETQEEAIPELKIAAEAYLESLKESGEELPSPETVSSFSGQIRLRMPKRLHENLSKEAENEGISLNTYIVSLLSERHSNKKIETMLEKMSEKIKIEHKHTKTNDANAWSSIASLITSWNQVIQGSGIVKSSNKSAFFMSDDDKFWGHVISPKKNKGGFEEKYLKKFNSRVYCQDLICETKEKDEEFSDEQDFTKEAY